MGRQMKYDNINDDYFSWMYDLVCGDRFNRNVSFKRLLWFLHDTEFVFRLPGDENRAEDGIDLRYRFAIDYTTIENAHLYLKGPCSVLEMMIALAFKMEDTMDDPLMGDRTAQWFWNMVVNLGLGSMNDSNFNEPLVHDTIGRFLCREYEPDGKGGLFVIRGCTDDLRYVDLWHQMCWYLNTII
jgi:hypothetical protein